MKEAGDGRPSARRLSPQLTNPLTAAFRIIWLLAAPAAAGLFVVLIAGGPSGLAAYDAGVAIAVSIAVIARYVDVARFRGETGDGRPASMHDFRVYALKMVAGFAVAWAIVRAWRGF